MTTGATSRTSTAGDTPMGFEIAIVNQKGGVGKTTTAVNLATSLATRAWRVLLVDLDPQGNATTSLGRTRHGGEGSYGLFAAQRHGPIHPRATTIAHLWLLEASMDLAGIDLELASAGDRALRLRAGLSVVEGHPFDFVILDCPPSFGVLTLNALTAARSLLVPLQCEYFALEGLANLKRTVNSVRAAYNPALDILGIVLTMFDRRNNLSELVASDVRAFFGELVLKTAIPRNIRLSEAPSHAMPIALYDPRSAGAVAYEHMTDEIVERVRARAVDA